MKLKCFRINYPVTEQDSELLTFKTEAEKYRNFTVDAVGYMKKVYNCVDEIMAHDKNAIGIARCFIQKKKDEIHENYKNGDQFDFVKQHTGKLITIFVENLSVKSQYSNFLSKFFS